MKRFTEVLRKFWNDEAGQGTAEYVLLLVLVVAIVVAFGGRLKSMLMSKTDSLESSISGFNPN